MTRPFTLRDWEAKARPRVLCRVIKEQPRPSWPFQPEISTAPIRPGDEVWYRETWRPKSLYDDGGHLYVDKAIEGQCRIEYKADQPVGTRYDNWRSPATMPRWASRRGAVCTDVRAEKQDGQWVWLYTMEEAE